MSCNANEVLMLRAKLKTLEERTFIVNKSVLEAKKERDKFHEELELLEVQLQGKRSHTHDDTGDGHDLYAEVDEWDLRDFHRETAHVQNRRNVVLGSLYDQPKSDKDWFFLHVRLGLVKWIVYWCNGDSTLTVDVVVVLINILDLKELVSVTLSGTKHKESDVGGCVQDYEVW